MNQYTPTLNMKKIDIPGLKKTAKRMCRFNLQDSESSIFIRLFEGRCKHLLPIGELFNKGIL